MQTMKCKDCPANDGKDICTIEVKCRMLVCGHYGCDLQRRAVEKRKGLKPLKLKRTKEDTRTLKQILDSINEVAVRQSYLDCRSIQEDIAEIWDRYGGQEK